MLRIFLTIFVIGCTAVPSKHWGSFTNKPGRGVAHSNGQNQKTKLIPYPSPNWSSERLVFNESSPHQLLEELPSISPKTKLKSTLFDRKPNMDHLDHKRSRPKPSFQNLKQNLLLWETVEKRFRELLERASQSQKLTLKSGSTHSFAVMSTVVGLANKLLRTCSTDEYVKRYRKTVSEHLLQAFASPLDVINELYMVLERVKRSTANVRALVRSGSVVSCEVNDPSNRCESPWILSKQSLRLNREKNLVQALGSLARTILSSRSLQRAINNYDEVEYLLNGKGAQLYVLTVKTARALKLLSSKNTCELPTLLPWLNFEVTENPDEF